ncbi:hypothetical protein EON63_06680 [archaeon]|nr:MAG: hypothetical protein EON63_06680 [archaeon]
MSIHYSSYTMSYVIYALYSIHCTPAPYPCIHAQVLEGHTDEIFSCAFNYEGDTIITGSKDNTCRIWKC